MKNYTACFTGHRIIPSADVPRLNGLLDKTIEKLIAEGITHWLSGGAMGFDTLAAQAIMKQREKNPAVMLIMVLPCRDQDARWREPDKQAYRCLLDGTNEVVCLSERYYNGCMAERNLYLTEHSSTCVAYMKQTRSGAGQTIRLARERGLRIINLA